MSISSLGSRKRILKAIREAPAPAASDVVSAEDDLKPGDTFRDYSECSGIVVIPSGSFMLADISVLQDRTRIREIIQGGETVNIEINKNARRLRSEFSYNKWSDIYTQARIKEIGMADSHAQRAAK